MKNNQFKQLNKIIKPRKSHAGFTLIELLSGLIMSTIVVAGLSFGLYQLTKITRDEGNKIKARNEILRAREFVADELRRAQSVEVGDSAGNLTNLATVAPSYAVPSGGTPRLALEIPGVDERIIYSVAPPPTGSSWDGPLVIYRWGPPFDANGEYTNANNVGAWQSRALIDNVDDSDQTVICNGNNNTYKGFFACAIDEDADGFAITAQLYFTSDIEIANGDNTKYEANTQVVARARTRNTNAAEEAEGSPLSFRTLAAKYSYGIMGFECGGEGAWTMRTDFINDPNLDSGTSYTPKTWIHDPDRQAQPISINTDHKLTITSVPFRPPSDSCDSPLGTSGILSRGNKNDASPTVDESTTTHQKLGDGSIWTPIPGVVSSDFTIDFSRDNGTDDNGTDIIKGDPTTFNGDNESGTYNNPNIPGVDHVKVYKNDSVIEYLPGYDDDPDPGTPSGEQSLADFLVEKGYAELSSGEYKIINLEENERIIAVEIGQLQEDGTSLITLPDGDPNPGFDLQDNVFILSTDKFKQKFPDDAF